MAWLYRTPPGARTPPHPSAVHGETRTDKPYIVCSTPWTEVTARGDR